MATVPDLSGNTPYVDEHIPSQEELQTDLLEEIEVNTTPAP